MKGNISEKAEMTIHVIRTLEEQRHSERANEMVSLGVGSISV